MGRRIYGLDLVRAAAIVAVLLAHLTQWFTTSGHFVNAASLVLGDFGVMLFFALSGFLIGGIALDTMPDADRGKWVGNFWFRRWMRTLPNYYLFLGVNAALALWGMQPMLLNVKHVVLVQNLVWPGIEFFGEAWSLFIEEVFYVALPLLAVVLALGRMKSKDVVRNAAIVLIAVPVLARLALGFWGAPEWDGHFRYISVLRLDAIGYGVLAAWISKAKPVAWAKNARLAFACGVGCIAVGAVAWLAMNSFSNHWPPVEARLTFQLALAAMGVGCALLLPWASALTKGPLLSIVVRLSLYSYSLYLANLPLAKVLNLLVGDRHASATLDLAVGGLWLVGCLLIAGLVYHWFEAPILGLRDRKKVAAPLEESTLPFVETQPTLSY